jgi:hypothetical protein
MNHPEPIDDEVTVTDPATYQADANSWRPIILSDGGAVDGKVDWPEIFLTDGTPVGVVK